MTPQPTGRLSFLRVFLRVLRASAVKQNRPQPLGAL